MSGATPSKRVHDLAMLNEWDPSDFNDASFDIIRMPKVPRTEADSKRSQLFQKYRVQSSSSLNTSQSDHTVNPEARVELGDFIRDNNNTKDAYNPVNSHQREFGSESLTTEDKHYKIETVSENKVDVEGDDRLKERDRKMKDGKQSEKLGKDRKDLEKEEDLDKECKEKRIEKDGDTEGDKSEKQSKGFDKDLDVQESADDKDKEAFNHGVQERKRMLRPKGSRSQDNDGSIGKSDMPAVVYSVGGCLQVFIRLWKEYETSSNISGKAPETSKCGPTLEICIPAEHVSVTNRQVKGSQLWGTDIYTGDSDLVAVLMHTGYCRPTASPPPPAIQELRATVRVLPPQDCYASTLRNNVRSRAWGAAIGCSFCVERCHIVKKGGGTIDLEPCLTHTSTVEPTLAPVVVERTITTRAAASNALRQQRFVREVTLQYNLCNEPWIKYSISAIADKGLKKPLFTSARLKKGEVLYLESRTRRYELCFNGEKMVKAGNGMETNGVDTDNNNNNNNNNNSNNLNNMVDVFRWSECKKPLPQTVMRSIGIPLPPEHLRVLEENLDWEDIQWSQTGVWISGNEHPLSRVHFLSPA